MIFTSYTYVGFLIASLGVHWILPSVNRNWFLVLASYGFYCSWRWEFGFLLLGVSLFTYYFGRLLHRRGGDGRLLALGVVLELLPLLYFKYAGFLVGNVAALAQAAGFEWRLGPLEILLPLGISFFSFQGVAYLVDIASGEDPFEDLRDFLLFKAFWPQLIAGPIIRPAEIHEQIVGPRALAFQDLAEGTSRILQGFFKKVVLADTLAPFVDAVFLVGARPAFLDSATGAIAFGLQIYFDFSAYSDIAIGSARLFGFRFPENFDYPYAAASPQDFWNRWHQSLSRWIRDYVFTPLTFATRGSRAGPVVWLVFAMAVCGLWHGAAWTFVAWGVWHGLLLALNQTLLRRFFGAAPPWSPRRAFASAVTFTAVTLGWILFRATSLTQAWDILWSLASLRGGVRPAILRENAVLIVALVLGALICAQVLAAAWRGGGQERLRAVVANPLARSVAYAVMIVAVVVFDREAKAFVYFQF